MKARTAVLVCPKLRMLLVAVCVASGSVGGTSAQDPQPSADTCLQTVPAAVSGFSYDRLRSDELRGRSEVRSQFVRRVSSYPQACAPAAEAAPLFSLAPARVQFGWSQRYPLDRNNGSLWAGRGAATALTAGAELRLGRVRIAVNPTVAHHQNKSFDIKAVDVPGYPNLINAGHPQTIDWPQRFGDDPFTTLDPGQSYIRLDTRYASVGVSHENVWIGPSLRSPLLLSNTASGFPHAFLSIPPFKTPVGRIAAEAIWGRLDESDYYDGDESNDHRLLTGLVIELEPRGITGLFVGVGRLYTTTLSGNSVLELLARPYGLGDAGTLRQIQDNALFAVFARYVLTEVGAEIWAEWGHENGFKGWWDALSEPDQSQAYVLGIQKLTPAGKRHLGFLAELAHLESALPLRGGRGAGSFYTHGAIQQGHTHKGQLLGAWIGPGSDAQIIALDLIDPNFSAGIYLERSRFDTDAYLDQWANYYGHNGHDALLAFGVRYSGQRGPLQAGLDASYGRRHNRSFLRLDGTQPVSFVSEDNIKLDLELIWRPPLGRSRAR